jgi:hypothetical protein
MVTGGMMKCTTVMWLVAAILLVSCVYCAGKTQPFVNETGNVATGIRIVFNTLVTVTSHDGAFPVMQPEDRAKEFVFTGGSIKPFGTFFVSWNTAAYVVRFEWLTGEQTGASTPAVRCSLTVSSERTRLSDVLQYAFDGAVICLGPGTYEFEMLPVPDCSFTLRGTGQTASDVVIKGPKYDAIAGLFVSGSRTVVIENLKFESSMVGTHGKAHLILKNVIAERVWAMGESTIEIESSLLLETQRHQTLMAADGTHVSIRDSVVEGNADAHEDAQFSVFNTVFQGPASGVTAYGSPRIEIRNCIFSLSLGIALRSGDFAGVVVGEGNIIAPSALQPASYPWPEGFIKQ